VGANYARYVLTLDFRFSPSGSDGSDILSDDNLDYKMAVVTPKSFEAIDGKSSWLEGSRGRAGLASASFPGLLCTTSLSERAGSATQITVSGACSASAKVPGRWLRHPLVYENVFGRYLYFDLHIAVMSSEIYTRVSIAGGCTDCKAPHSLEWFVSTKDFYHELSPLES
jgi:hypothetical protein